MIEGLGKFCLRFKLIHDVKRGPPITSKPFFIQSAAVEHHKLLKSFVANKINPEQFNQAVTQLTNEVRRHAGDDDEEGKEDIEVSKEESTAAAAPAPTTAIKTTNNNTGGKQRKGNKADNNKSSRCSSATADQRPTSTRLQAMVIATNATASSANAVATTAQRLSSIRGRSAQKLSVISKCSEEDRDCITLNERSSKKRGRHHDDETDGIAASTPAAKSLSSAAKQSKKKARSNNGDKEAQLKTAVDIQDDDDEVEEDVPDETFAIINARFNKSMNEIDEMKGLQDY